MKNGWTGGQYSLFRALCGAYLLIHFAMLVPYGGELFSNQGVLPDASASPLVRLFPNVLSVVDSPAAVTTLLAVAIGATVFFAIGWFDRIAALVIWYVLACLFGRNPLIANPSLPMMGWLLLAHACLPRAPYLSVAARGRVDPRGGWRFPPALFAATWIVMSLAYTYSGYVKLSSPSWLDGTAMRQILDNPLARPGWFRDLAIASPALVLKIATWAALALELLFAPLALLPRARPWIWMLMVAMHLGLLLVIDFADLTFGMLVFHLFAFDPAWIRAAKAGTTDVVFFDGSCGLCHRGVRWFLAEDRTGTAFTFAPLGGERFTATMPDRAGLPDSLVVRTADGRTLTQSTGVVWLTKRCGGLWRIVATLIGVVPRPVRDAIYGLIARVRYRLFARPKDACPMLPADLRSRFVA